MARLQKTKTGLTRQAAGHKSRTAAIWSQQRKNSYCQVWRWLGGSCECGSTVLPALFGFDRIAAKSGA